MSLEQHKELLTEGCKIFLSNTKVLPEKKHTVCKIVQHGDWTSALNYQDVVLLPAKKKRGPIKVLDVKSVAYKGQKHKLVLTEDSAIYKIKRSRLEDDVKPEQCI